MIIKKDSEETRAQAVQIVNAGGIIAFRTDTFYGLGVDPLNPKAVSRIIELKGREAAKPILVLISDTDLVERFIGEPSGLFGVVAVGHWPAPLTLIGPARPELPVELTAGTNSIGVRLPDDATVRAFVRACGGALTATSANVSGSPPARTAREVQNYFPTGIELIVDRGEVEVTKPSTVVDLTGPEPRLVRDGALDDAVLEKILATQQEPH